MGDPNVVPDLLAELSGIQKHARRARQAIYDGRATTGATALYKIEKEAEDAVRHARDRFPAEAGHGS